MQPTLKNWKVDSLRTKQRGLIFLHLHLEKKLTQVKFQMEDLYLIIQKLTSSLKCLSLTSRTGMP